MNHSVYLFLFVVTAIQCEPPIEIAHGVMQIPTDTLYGSEVKYTCNVGFKMLGPNKITCLANGQYDSLPPSCERKFILSLIIQQ